MKAHIEIYRDGLWRRLILTDNKSVKYNALINKIGVLSTREISHTDTFSLPFVSENIKALGINLFNKLDLAQALNSKFQAKYYIGDKLFQEGFLLINNTNNNEINVNFIDESLNLVERWGETSFSELLRGEDKNAEIPSDIQSSIDEMKNYRFEFSGLDSEKSWAKDYLTNIGTLDFPLASFPNNLNTIGDKFQVNRDNIRYPDRMNTTQSRPIFSVMGFLETITRSYGYTPIYDESINWERIKTNFIVSKDSSKDYKTEILRTNVKNEKGYDSDETYLSYVDSGDGNKRKTYSVVSYGSGDAIVPSTINGWYEFWSSRHPVPIQNTNYRDIPCIIPLDLSDLEEVIDPDSGEALYVGKVAGDLNYQIETATEDTGVFTSWVIFETLSGGFYFEEMRNISEDLKEDGVIKFHITKDDIINNPEEEIQYGVTNVMGIFTIYQEIGSSSSTNTKTVSKVNETVMSPDVVRFDEYKQYVGQQNNLLHSAPVDNIKKLLKGILQKDGILMNIDPKAKEVRFFGYSRYLELKRQNIFKDWSKYLRRHNPYSFNTDYGNEYGKKNIISLSEPYLGNTYTVSLSTQKSNSKYKDSAENVISTYKDVEEIKYIQNPNFPYFEYLSKGLGMVEYTGNIRGISPTHFNKNGDWDGVNETIFSLDKFSNVNYTSRSSSILSWYSIVDLAVRCTPEFLLPTDVVSNLDLSIPIYVNDLGGYYIIEEVSEYINDTELVRVKLIKLLELGGFSDGFSNGFNN